MFTVDTGPFVQAMHRAVDAVNGFMAALSPGQMRAIQKAIRRAKVTDRQRRQALRHREQRAARRQRRRSSSPA